MLKELHEKLFGLLNQAGVAAYAEDCIPDTACFPFAACRIEAPVSPFGTGRVTLTGWVRSAAPQEERIGLAQTLLQLVPRGGRMISLTAGLAALFPAEDQAVTWPETTGALGVRICFTLLAAGGVQSERREQDA